MSAHMKPAEFAELVARQNLVLNDDGELVRRPKEAKANGKTQQPAQVSVSRSAEKWRRAALAFAAGHGFLALCVTVLDPWFGALYWLALLGAAWWALRA